jgi:septal ring factor EnvC (AmiA/AmiB activator)
MASWETVQAAALKILGDGAKVPDAPDNIAKAIAEVGKSNTELDKSREDIEAKLLAVQNGNDVVRNSLKQFDAKIEKSDFELDSKNKENLKKIQKARKVLTDYLDKAIKAWGDDDKILDELDKHVIQLGKYKPKSGPL